MNDMIHTLLAHRSIRKFTDDPIPDDHIEVATRAGQMASTSSAVQAYCAIRVTNPDSRRVIADLAGPQQKVADAPAFFVICGDARRHRLLCECAGQKYRQQLEGFLISVIDATLFAQNMVIAFESLGYGICYIGGIRNDLARVAEVLRLPIGVYPIFGLCVGKPAESPDERPRLPTPGVLFEDTYPTDEEVFAQIDAYDAAYAAYLAKRGASATGWSRAMVKKMDHASRLTLGPFYREQGADLD